MLQDLHSHTYYSFCGRDVPDAPVLAAIHGGVRQFGICDHLYGIGHVRPGTEYASEEDFLTDYQRSIDAYLHHMRLLQEKYKDKIALFCGVEIPTLGEDYLRVPDGLDFSGFDYALVEHLSLPGTVVSDLFAFADRLGLAHVGIAHTDMFAMLSQRGLDPLDYFSRMAEKGIFWELNVNYDSIHGYHEHGYVKEFLANREQQELIKKSGVCLSVGFDGHRVEDYLPNRVADACRALEKLGLPQVNLGAEK